MSPRPVLPLSPRARPLERAERRARPAAGPRRALAKRGEETRGNPRILRRWSVAELLASAARPPAVN
jgi:hypothetical protein